MSGDDMALWKLSIAPLECFEDSWARTNETVAANPTIALTQGSSHWKHRSHMKFLMLVRANRPLQLGEFVTVWLIAHNTVDTTISRKRQTYAQNVLKILIP